jgi:hypothetical protein
VPVFGIIKEVSPDPEDSFGTQEFQENFFPYEIFRDDKLQFYKFLGKRSLFSLMSWNPFTWGSVLSMSSRTDEKGIPGNLKGEGTKLGGVLVVSKTKGVVYQYLEMTGDLLPVEEIQKAVADNM